MIKTSGKTIILRDFSLMRDGSPIYYAENFGIEDYGFGKVLVPLNAGSKKIDEDTATLTKYAGDAFIGITGIDAIDENGIRFLFWIDSKCNVWCMKKSNDTGQKLFNTGVYNYYADLKATGIDTNNSIIFSTWAGVGRIFRGSATGGSATTLDDTTVDFTTADWDLQPGDYVYNLKDNKLFTIDAGGVAATRLTITAVDGGDFAAFENYVIVNPNWKSFGWFPGSAAILGRQIIEFDEDFYILEGDCLALVDSSMSFTDKYKALETKWVARTGASNGDTMAIGANKNYKGRIFIWDKYSNGWNKKISVDDKILSIVAYKSGYIFISGNALWWTDTYTTRMLSEIPGIEKGDTFWVDPRGMIISGNIVLINGGINKYNKTRKGIWTYKIQKNEWAYSPYEPKDGEEKSSYGTLTGALFFDSSSNDILYTFKNSGYGWTNEYIMSLFNLGYGSSRGTVITNPIRLGKDARIKKIEVNLVQNLKDSDNASGKSKTMTCKLSDCTRPLWRHQQANADSTVKNKIQVDGDVAGNANAQVGDEIFILDGWNGHLRRRITAIANDGTNTEEWTLDSDLAELTKDNTTIIVMPFQLYDMDEKIITDETKMLEFYPSFYGDSVMIELGITGSDYPLIAIESIRIYYE